MLKKMLDSYRRHKLEKNLRYLRDNNIIKTGENTIIKNGTSFDFRIPRNNLSVEIGNDCMIACNFIFESESGHIKIGDRSYITGGANLITRNGITIGNDVTIAWGCYIYDHDSHSIYAEDRIEEKRNYDKTGSIERFARSKTWKNVNSAPITICDKVWIGFDVLILKGVTIGEGSIIGAKSVVTHDIPPWCIAAGNPARVVKRIPKRKEEF